MLGDDDAAAGRASSLALLRMIANIAATWVNKCKPVSWNIPSKAALVKSSMHLDYIFGPAFCQNSHDNFQAIGNERSFISALTLFLVR